MALYMQSLVRCKHDALKKLYFKSIVKCFKRVIIDKWSDLPISFSTIDWCVIINGEPDRLFSGDMLNNVFTDDLKCLRRRLNLK